MIFCLILPLLALYGQETDWQLKKEKNGIKVYTQPSDEGLLVYRAETVLDAQLEEVLGAVVDVNAYNKWMPDTKEAKVLESSSEVKAIYYLSTKAPWPVTDRDGIYQFEISYNQGDEAVRVEFGALPDYLPEDEDHVRIRRSSGYWKLTRLDGGRVAIDYMVKAEAGGNVPDWLARAKIVSIPFETITNMREQVEEGHFADHTFSFLGN